MAGSVEGLYHYSEEPDIARFTPRPPLAHPEQPPLVWAIDAWHAPHYYFPRDCPRVCFWAGSRATAADVERLVGPTTARRVIAIEHAWLDRLRQTTLYEYALPPETFTAHDEAAGYHVSAVAVTPRAVRPLGDLLAHLVASGEIELRLTPSLWPLHRALVGATLEFSMIRLRNARPAEGTP
jgi:hypothetical protein